MLSLYKRLFFLLFFLFHYCNLNAQIEESDSYEKRKGLAIAGLNQHQQPDTNRVNALTNILHTAIFLKEKRDVAPYLSEAMELSRQLEYKRGIANCYLFKANFAKSASDYKNAILYYDSASVFANNPQNEDIALVKQMALQQLGSIYYSQENYYTALDYYLESLKYIPPGKDAKTMRVYTFITEIYTLLNNFEKAAEYAKINTLLAEHSKDTSMAINVYFSYIDVCLELADLSTAAFYLNKIAPVIPSPDQYLINYGYYLKRGRVYYKLQQFSQAYFYFQEAYKNAIKGEHVSSKSTALYFLSSTALQLGLHEDAKAYALQNLALNESLNIRGNKIEALTNLSSYYEKTGNKTKAYQLLKQAMLLKDSLTKDNNTKQVNILGAIYDYAKQQKEIAKLQNEKEKQAAAVKQKSQLNNFFIASIFALLFLGYLGFVNFKKGQELAKQKQTFQQQKISELEKNKQLSTIDAMLKGQEEERSRIAKDLHDGLGSLLSGTKLSFLNVKETLDLTTENRILFEKSLSMLDNTIGDLRKVAQNLMPEALVKFGLHEALRDFCDSIQSSTGITVLYQQFGNKRKIDNTAEVNIYRIIQELVNNAVKHAEANEIIVQVAFSEEKIGITVEDNGKGFDKTDMNSNKGAGLSNIKHRVQYFNGSCDLVTTPGNGASITIEIKA